MYNMLQSKYQFRSVVNYSCEVRRILKTTAQCDSCLVQQFIYLFIFFFWEGEGEIRLWQNIRILLCKLYNEYLFHARDGVNVRIQESRKTKGYLSGTRTE